MSPFVITILLFLLPLLGCVYGSFLFHLLVRHQIHFVHRHSRQLLLPDAISKQLLTNPLLRASLSCNSFQILLHHSFFSFILKLISSFSLISNTYLILTFHLPALTNLLHASFNYLFHPCPPPTKDSLPTSHPSIILSLMPSIHQPPYHYRPVIHSFTPHQPSSSPSTPPFLTQ